MGRDGATIEFTDRELRLITDSLPKEVDQQRLDLFPQMLQEWRRTYLPELLSLKPEPREVRQARFKRLTALLKHAAGLVDALDALDAQPDLTRNILYFACPLEISPSGLIGANVKRAAEELEATCEFLLRLTVAAGAVASPSTPRRGRPRNDVPFFILCDLARILEWLTGSKPSRQVNPEGEEAGPLADLARAVWPVIFGSDDGLPSAIRNWASPRRAYGEKSAVI